MGIFGVDIHPRYQSGISIEQIRREGAEFLIVKTSQGTDTSYMKAGTIDFVNRGKACGLVCMGYHYLNAGNEDAQAQTFGRQLNILGVPGMLDAEEGSGNINNIRAFVDACRRHGVPLPLMYLPRWYWQKIGSPGLAGLPLMVASRYVSGGPSSMPDLYTRHNAAGWNSYGGLEVAVLQFADNAMVAGYKVDANHFRGTREDFINLIHGQAEDDMAQVSQQAFDDLCNRVRDIQDQLRGPNCTEWPTFRYNVQKGEDNSFTVTDFIRVLDREVTSWQNLEGRPGGDTDRMVGHILTTHALAKKIMEKLDSIAAKIKA
jgi:lysozyme